LTNWFIFQLISVPRIEPAWAREFPAGLGRAAQKPDWLLERGRFERETLRRLLTQFNGRFAARQASNPPRYQKTLLKPIRMARNAALYDSQQREPLQKNINGVPGWPYVSW
jgi:hypothetical protein